MKHVLALLMMAAAYVTWGCASADQASVQSLSCQTADQCSDGFICVEFQCRLASQVVGPDAVSVEIIPPRGSPYTRLHRLDVSLENAARTLMLRFPVPIEYQATVLDSESNNVPSDLLIFGADRIPGRELEHRSFVDGLGTRFLLTPGTYAARVRPADPNLPGLDVDSFSVREGAALPKEFVLPEEYRRLSGRVVQAQAMQVAYEGALVQAIGEKSLLASTLAVADADGNYEVLLPDTSDTVFRVTAVLPTDQQPSWGYAESIRVETDGDRPLDIQIERSNDDNRGTVVLSVVGMAAGGGGVAIANALVTMTASVTDRLTPPVYNIAGMTNANGQVLVAFGDDVVDTIPLLRARYVVDVRPPVGSPFAGTRTVFDFRSAGTNFTLDRQIQLEVRPIVSGPVSSALGAPIEAVVTFEPLEENLERRETTSNVDGRYELTMDPGRYLMIVRPVDDELRGELLPVGTEVVEIPPVETFVVPQLRLRTGNRLSGLVRGDLTSEPIGNADVQMFVRQENLTVSLGTTVTDGAGAFTLVLPVP